MIDKRRSPRFQKGFDLNCIKTQISETTQFPGRMLNISSSGLCGRFDTAMDQGDTMIVEAKVEDDKKIAVLARVVWANKSDEGATTCGVRFLWVSPQDLLDDVLK